jgi:pyruvate,water dikinase
MHDYQMLLRLGDAAARDRCRTGTKAAALATLLQAGFAVPDGMVLTTLAFEASAASGGAPGSPPAAHAHAVGLRDALELLADHYGNIPVAVRSSALAEDLPDATFAGQYETFLDVRGPAAIEDAVHRCWSSLRSPAARAYREHANSTTAQAMAVLIQPMVTPTAAGVALGADPFTGDRSRALISAVRGLAEPLVSGQAVAEEWDITAATASCRSPAAPEVLTAAQAAAVGSTLRRVEDLLGGPLDVEWAINDDQVLILQARPMTALPAQAAWPAPRRGVWLRTIRLGEWLPEPITPLFETWLLQRLEERFRLRQQDVGGISAPPPLHVCVNGWYFHSPIGSGRQTVLFRGMLRRPRLALATVLGSRRPAAADRLFFSAQAARWRQDVLAPYQRAVAVAASRIETAPPAELAPLVDHLADLAGDYFWSLVLCGGAAWRFEIALARFHRRHLKGKVSESYQALLGGLTAPDPPAHAVHSLDWFRETIGELPASGTGPNLASARHDEARNERLAAEAACRRVLAAQPRRQARFIRLLTLAQRYAVIRAEHAAWFTLAWPVMRQSARRLGRLMLSAGLLDDADDIFFISGGELGDYLAGRRPQQLSARARQRRAAWEHSRRLSPPLVLGKAPLLLAKVLLSSPKVARPVIPAGSGALCGTPASPGAAGGPVRVVRDPADAEAVRPGDVLVVSAAVPALARVFDRIAALCVDGGSVAAHASLLAREYGIPAVTGLGDATSRLSDGMWVFVDGSAGVVDVR